jgi:hypothetical protein
MSYFPNVYASQAGPLLLSGLDANFNFAVDIQSQSLYAAAGGTSDVITATYTPTVTSLVSGLTLYLRAATANTTTTPTFSPNGLTARTIVKINNQALSAGDIAGAGHVLILQYDATNTVWELVNPAIPGTKEAVYAITDAAAFEINPANGGIQTITLGASRTPKGTNFAAGQSVLLSVTAGSYTLTWTDTTFGASGVKWIGSSAPGSAPTLSTSATTFIELWKIGSQVYGALVGVA